MASDAPAASRRDRSPAGRRTLRLVALPGRVPYRRGLALQRRLAREKIEGGEERDWLLLVEHEPVLTLGRGADPEHLAAGPAELERRGIERVEIERGGDVTYHGPGQLVGYPILDLSAYRRDLHWYVRRVEDALVAALSELGLFAFPIRGHTGVWVGEAGGDGSGGSARAATPALDAEQAGPAIASGRVRKIASIGIHVSRWVSWHGFALNVTREPLERFDLIVPCGIRGVRMTSLESEGCAVGRDRLLEAVGAGFAAALGVRVGREEPEAVGWAAGKVPVRSSAD